MSWLGWLGLGLAVAALAVGVVMAYRWRARDQREQDLLDTLERHQIDERYQEMRDAVYDDHPTDRAARHAAIRRLALDALERSRRALGPDGSE